MRQCGSCDKRDGTSQVRTTALATDKLTERTTEFRKVRENHEFFEICRTPDLATEITVQPIRRYTGLIDASIIFSDILVIPQAMGMEVQMNPGPFFPDPLTSPEDVKKLHEDVDVNKELGYVFEAITQTRTALNGEVPLIGFCGAPWTLFAYMVEGGGSKTLQKAKSWLFQYPEESKALLIRIADVCVDYLVGQVKAGAQVSTLLLIPLILLLCNYYTAVANIRLVGGRACTPSLRGILLPHPSAYLRGSTPEADRVQYPRCPHDPLCQGRELRS